MADWGPYVPVGMLYKLDRTKVSIKKKPIVETRLTLPTIPLDASNQILETPRLLRRSANGGKISGYLIISPPSRSIAIIQHATRCPQTVHTKPGPPDRAHTPGQAPMVPTATARKSRTRLLPSPKHLRLWQGLFRRSINRRRWSIGLRMGCRG